MPGQSICSKGRASRQERFGERLFEVIAGAVGTVASEAVSQLAVRVRPPAFTHKEVT